MQYFVIWPDGQKFGPATVDKLNEWIAEGRINGDTLLESVEGGSQIKASAVPGLNFPAASAAVSEPEPAAPASAPQPQAAPFAPRYYVTMPDGNRYGPADVSTLNQWLSEGRINANSMLEDEAGQSFAASQVQGLNLGYTPSPIQQPSYQAPTTPYPRQDNVMVGDGGKGDYTKSLVFSIVGVICCPIILSSLGIYYGNKAKQAGHPNGQLAVVLGVVSLIVGIGLGILSRLMFKM
ncbi:MAG: hypothetical protein KF857_08095 [Fimbriimonadaceae bacterium]|nr:hypothetical protein [Fimbriimonadaceae bacterium]